MSSNNLTADALEQYERRSEIGVRCIEIAHGSSPVAEDDRETAASDAISDILTALFGPAGTWVGGSRFNVEWNEDAKAAAAALLDHALRSWEGDAEDYDLKGNDDA